ncbi:unnamed protein product [Arctogadus glacialis]
MRLHLGALRPNAGKASRCLTGGVKHQRLHQTSPSDAIQGQNTKGFCRPDPPVISICRLCSEQHMSLHLLFCDRLCSIRGRAVGSEETGFALALGWCHWREPAQRK